MWEDDGEDDKLDISLSLQKLGQWEDAGRMLGEHWENNGKTLGG
jgi:hypothetical protein